MKKIINQAPIVRYRASVSAIFFPDFWNRTFSTESDVSYLSITAAIFFIHRAVRNYWGPNPIRLEMCSHEMGRMATPAVLHTAPAASATRVRLETRSAAARES